MHLNIADEAREIWLPVHGMEGILEVSNHARVRTRTRVSEAVRNGVRWTQTRPGKILNPWLSQSGYLTVAVMVSGKRRKYSLHRLVARAFVPGFADDLSVNHINGVKTDNRIVNLEWVSLAANTHHEWDTGLVDLRGEAHPGRKLSAKQVRIIRSLLSRGIPANQLATLADVSHATIALIRDGKRWNSLPVGSPADRK